MISMSQLIGRRVLSMIVSLTACGFFAGARMEAAEVDFGLVGITGVDTARLSVLCSDDTTSTAPPQPCAVEFHFHDVSGRIVKQAEMTLQPGVSGFLDVRSSEVGLASVGGRVGIIPCYFVGSGRAFGALRIFDNFTLRQRIFANSVEGSKARSGEVHFGVAGITPFETARLNAVCKADPKTDGPPSCEVTLIFHLSGGRILKQATLTLEPGAGGSLQLRTTEFGLTARLGEIIPCIKVGRGSAVSTFEVIDTASGLTTLLAHPATAVGLDPPEPVRTQ